MKGKHLTKSEIARILVLYKVGLNYPAIAERLGVMPNTVYRILAKSKMQKRKIQ